MNIKGKILNLPGYCVFTQNEASRCGNRGIGKAKSKTDGTNLRKIIFPIFPKFSRIFRQPHAPPRACTRLGRLGAREDQRVPCTRRSSSPATAHRRCGILTPLESPRLVDHLGTSWTFKGGREDLRLAGQRFGSAARHRTPARPETPSNVLLCPPNFPETILRLWATKAPYFDCPICSKTRPI